MDHRITQNTAINLLFSIDWVGIFSPRISPNVVSVDPFEVGVETVLFVLRVPLPGFMYKNLVGVLRLLVIFSTHNSN